MARVKKKRDPLETATMNCIAVAAANATTQVSDDADTGLVKEDPKELRFSRYSGIIPPEKLKDAHVTIVGVGAVGRQAALMLAHVGVGGMSICDPDKVSYENMGAQGYRMDQVDKHKVEALYGDLKGSNPEMLVWLHGERFGEHDVTDKYVFCCVDCMEARKAIFAASAEKAARLFIESRMGAEGGIVHAFEPKDTEACRAWERSWYPSDKAVQERCSERTTLYGATMVACLMVAQFARFLGGRPLTYRSTLLLPTNTFDAATAGEVNQWLDEDDQPTGVVPQASPALQEA